MSYSEIDGLVIFTREVRAFAMDNTFAPAKLPSKVRMKEDAKTFKWKPWGENNLYPIKVKDALAASAAAQICAETLSTYTYGRGLGVFKRVITDGKQESVPVTTAEHLKFFNANFIKDYLVRSITDYWWFGNTFPQFVLNKEPKREDKKIALIRNIDAPFCRIGWQNEETLDIDQCYINGNWALLPALTEIEQVKILDRYTATEQIKTGTDLKYMYLGYSYTPGELYYHKHPWHAALDTGVMDLAPEIPKLRKARFKNALFIKYHVQIEEQYWEKISAEKKWQDMKAEERRELKNSVYQMIDSKLGGTDNAFKSLFSDKITNAQGNTINLISITKIETDFGETAAFDPDKMSNVADMFLAFGIPAPIMNTVLSDTKSRGGGSDIREGLIAMQMKLQMHRDNILAPLEFMMRFNGQIADDEYLNFEDIKPTTLDVNPTGQQNVVA
jgi:hypothetical protein